jgi:hypothetical protein
VNTPQDEWLIEGVVPRGVMFAIADVSDGMPEEILARGYDVVMHLGAVKLGAEPVLMTVVWRDGLVPGMEPPEPFWVAFVPGAGIVAVDPSAGAGS